VFPAEITVHLSLTEAVVIALILLGVAARELLHALRFVGDELITFIDWWRLFRARLRASMPHDLPQSARARHATFSEEPHGRETGSP
jgi:hypothetical protein